MLHVRWQYWAHPSGLSIVILWVNTNSQKGKSYAMPLPEVSDVSVNSGREEGRNDDESGMIGKRQRLRRLKLRLFISQRREGVVIIIWKGRAGPRFFARILGPCFAC